MNRRPAGQAPPPLFSQAVRAGQRHAHVVRGLRLLFVILLIGGTVMWRHGASADQVPVPDTASLAAGTTLGFMQTTTVSPQSIAPGASTTITTAVMAMQTALVNGIIDIEVYDAANHKVGQKFFVGQAIPIGQSVRQTYSWVSPTAGTYRVAIGVFGPNWTPLDLWANNASTITVASTPTSTWTATVALPTGTSTATAVPATATGTNTVLPATSTGTTIPPTETATASPVPPTATGTVAASGSTSTPVPPTSTGTTATANPAFTQVTTVNPASGAGAYTIGTRITSTSGTLQNGLIDIEVYDATYKKVGQQVFSGQNLAAGQSVTQTISWTAPAAGTYYLAVGVFGANWTPNYFWSLPAATFSYSQAAAILNSATPTASLVGSSTASPVLPTASGTAVPPSSTGTPLPPSATGTSTAASTSTTATATAGASNVPVPTNLAAQPDDRAAVLTWNADMTPGSSDPSGVHGYKVTWGPQSNPSQYSALTMYRIIEAQPLVNGQTYVATIQAVDNDGHLSASSAPITFTGDSSRVDSLRTQMTGFFDDFNNPSLAMLAPDARNWNSAVSYCNNDPATEGVFLNDQAHVHNLLYDNHCDRGQNVSRPRATFDFTGRTGTITFDMDGMQRRDIWYLDLVPRLMDVDGNVQLEGQPGASGTAHSLRFKQSGQGVDICYIDGSGIETCFANTAPGAMDNKLAWDNLTLVPNVRRHWVLHVSQHHADVYVNGVEQYATDAINLPFTTATVLWMAFSYNTRKSNEDRVLFHWDNFGFDGPAPLTETHNYIADGCCGGGDFAALSGAPISKSITIPDTLTGETAERLLFSMQMPSNSFYTWNSGDKVTVNGYTCMITQPGPSTIPIASLVGTLAPYTVECDLPLGTLHTNTNTVVFSMTNSGVIDVHTEVDFPKGQAPSYTQPPLSGMPMGATALPDIGPGATIEQIGSCSDTSCFTWANPHGPFSAHGTVPLKYSAQEGAALDGNGKIPGIKEIQITIDGQVVLDRHTNAQAPAPAVADVYNLDTTRLSNGTHQLRILAWNANGTVSIPDYFQAESTEGTDWPIALVVSN